MKRAKQTLWLFVLYFLLQPVSPASAYPQITLSAGTGHTGDFISISGTGFLPNYSGGFVYFDQNFDRLPNSYSGGIAMCGKLNDTPCEPWVPVNSDSSGNFTAYLIVPPGYKADFLGTGTYEIAADLPLGGGPDATVPFKVLPASFSVNPITATIKGLFGNVITIDTGMVAVSGIYFAPYRPDLAQSYGIVWEDTNGDLLWNDGEPYAKVYVLSDGSLSACQTSACQISLTPETTKLPTIPLKSGIYLRADIYQGGQGDVFRSPEQKVEASALLPH